MMVGQQLDGKIGIVKGAFLKRTPIAMAVNSQTYPAKSGAIPTKTNSMVNQSIRWVYGMAAPEVAIQSEEEKPTRRRGISADISGGVTPEPKIIKPENFESDIEHAPNLNYENEQAR